MRLHFKVCSVCAKQFAEIVDAFKWVEVVDIPKSKRINEICKFYIGKSFGVWCVQWNDM